MIYLARPLGGVVSCAIGESGVSFEFIRRQAPHQMIVIKGISPLSRMEEKLSLELLERMKGEFGQSAGGFPTAETTLSVIVSSTQI